MPEGSEIKVKGPEVGKDNYKDAPTPAQQTRKWMRW